MWSRARCILSYSDLPYAAVMRIGSRVQAAKVSPSLIKTPKTEKRVPCRRQQDRYTCNY